MCYFVEDHFRGNNFRKTQPPLLADSPSLTHSLTPSHTHLTHSLHPTHYPVTPHPTPSHPTPSHPTPLQSLSLPFTLPIPHPPLPFRPPSLPLSLPPSLFPSLPLVHSLTPPHPPHLTPPHLVFLKLFLRLPVLISSSPLKILEGFCCAIHSNRIHVLRNDLICVIEECLFCLYNGRKADRIWNYIFQLGQSSMLAIGTGRLCLLKIYIYEKTTFWLKMIWHKIGPSQHSHISLSCTIGHGVSNDTKYSMVYSSHLSMMGTRNWCATS